MEKKYVSIEAYGILENVLNRAIEELIERDYDEDLPNELRASRDEANSMIRDDCVVVTAPDTTDEEDENLETEDERDEDEDPEPDGGEPGDITGTDGVLYSKEQLKPDGYDALSSIQQVLIDESIDRYGYLYPRYVEVNVFTLNRTLLEITCKKGIGVFQALKDAGIFEFGEGGVLLNGEPVNQSTQIQSFSVISIQR